MYLTNSFTSRVVNQRFAPSGEEFGGRPWESLGTIATTSGDIRVEAVNQGTGNLTADAVRLERPVLPLLESLDLRGNPLDDAAHEYVLSQLLSNRPGEDDPETPWQEYAALDPAALQWERAALRKLAARPLP